MDTNVDDSLFNCLQVAQLLQRYAMHCRVVIDYTPESDAFLVNISKGDSNSPTFEYEFRDDWSVASKNINHMEQLKALWDIYEAN